MTLALRRPHSPRQRREETATILGNSLPLTAAYVAEMGMVITDMIIVGRLGSKELAAVGLAGDWFWILLLIGMGVISIVGVIAEQSLGADDRQSVIEAGEQGMIAAVIASIPVMICVWYLGPVLGRARKDPQVVELITGYSRILTFDVLPALCFALLRNYITALARSSAIGVITVGALLLNLALNYTLVYGRFGFPALGVVGAGYGTTIVNWVMFGALALHVLYSGHFAEYRPNLIPGRVRVAYGIGRRSVDASRQSAHIAFFLATLTTLAAALILWIFPGFLVGIFLDTSNPENATVLRTSIGLSGYAGIFLLLDGILMVIDNAVRGLRDTRSPLWISMAGYWAVGLGSGVWLCFPLGYGARGLWSELVADVVFSNILMYRQFTRRLADARIAPGTS